MGLAPPAPSATQKEAALQATIAAGHPAPPPPAPPARPAGPVASAIEKEAAFQATIAAGHPAPPPPAPTAPSILGSVSRVAQLATSAAPYVAPPPPPPAQSSFIAPPAPPPAPDTNWMVNYNPFVNQGINPFVNRGIDMQIDPRFNRGQDPRYNPQYPRYNPQFPRGMDPRKMRREEWIQRGFDPIVYDRQVGQPNMQANDPSDVWEQSLTDDGSSDDTDSTAGYERGFRQERRPQYIQSIEAVSAYAPLLPDVSVDLSTNSRLAELRRLAIDLSAHAQELMQPNATLNITARAGSLNSIAAQIVGHIDRMLTTVNPEVTAETPAAYGEIGTELTPRRSHGRSHGHHGMRNPNNIIG